MKGGISPEAYPKFQKDAANFQKSELILKTDGMVPAAMQVHALGKQRTVYKFDDVVINDRFWFLDPNPIPPASTPPSMPLSGGRGWLTSRRHHRRRPTVTDLASASVVSHAVGLHSPFPPN